MPESRGDHKHIQTYEVKMDRNTVIAVWLKGVEAPGYDPVFVRKDCFGNLIEFNQYGQDTQFGWEIDHIIPKARGGIDHISNYQPLQWEANRKKSDKLLLGSLFRN